MTRSTKILTVIAAMTLFALLEASAAEARRGGFHGRGVAGPRISVVVPPIGFYGGYYGFYSPYYYGFYGPRFHGPYLRPEGGLHPTHARLMGVGAIDLAVKPGKAEVWVDGKYVGTARDFDGYPAYLWLKEGDHEVTLYRGGFETETRTISISPGAVVKLKLKLQEGESQPPEPAAAKDTGPKA